MSGGSIEKMMFICAMNKTKQNTTIKIKKKNETPKARICGIFFLSECYLSDL